MKIIRLHPKHDSNPIYLNPEHITHFKTTDYSSDGHISAIVYIRGGKEWIVHETVKQLLEMLHMDWIEDNE